MPIVQMIEPRRGPATSILAFSRRTSSAAGQCRAGAEGRWQRTEKTTGKQTRQMKAQAQAPPNEEGHETESKPRVGKHCLASLEFMFCGVPSVVCGLWSVVCGSLSVWFGFGLVGPGVPGSQKQPVRWRTG